MTDLFNFAWLRRTSNNMLAYRRLFQRDGKVTGDGERVLRDLAEFCGQSEPSISMDNQGRVDGLAMAVREGRREVYLRILKMLDPAAYSDLQQRLLEASQEEH